jgi:hypothetical protein
MEGGRLQVVNNYLRADSVLELGGKHLSAIGNHVVCYAVFAEHVFESIPASSGESISFLQGR